MHFEQLWHKNSWRGLRGSVIAVSTDSITLAVDSEAVTVYVNRETIIHFVATHTHGTVADIQVGNVVSTIERCNAADILETLILFVRPADARSDGYTAEQSCCSKRMANH